MGDGEVTTIGGSLAAEVARAADDQPALGHAADEPCANCGTVRCGPYCHACGQSGHVHRTAGALVHDLANGVFHFEGKVWATLPLLAWRPGELTRRYAHGERAKFVSPIALFLFSVFLMFTIVSGLAGGGHRGSLGEQAQIAVDDARARTRLANDVAARRRTRDAGQAAALDRKIAAERRAVAALDAGGRAARDGIGRGDGHGVTDLHVDTGFPALDVALRRVAANPDLALYKAKSYGYKYSWVLIPLSLPLIWLLFAFRRDVGLYDHAVFATYSLSFMSLGVVAFTLLGAIGLPGAPIGAAVLIVPPWHMYRQLKDAYRLGRLGAAWRTVALLAIALVSALLFLALLFYLGSE